MEIEAAVVIFAALAQGSRLAILRLLVERGPTGMLAGAIAERLGLPASTTSFHLAALERAGLVQSVRRGRQMIYAARFLALRSLLAFLTESCCGGNPALCGDLTRLLPAVAEDNQTMQPAFNVLFLCTRNAARSIMAEAILQQIGGGRFHAYSAGSDPADAPMPDVLAKLGALGHDVSRLHCKSWNAFTGAEAPRIDFVIALCDMLDNQICPDFGDKAVTGAWPLPDPARFTGGAAERSALLNELYASLRRRIELFISLPFATLDRMALRARLDEIGEGPVGALARAGGR
jgi:protein-tyrosine-phosphatase/DNA-binding transcriptional ArsR family regulator